MIQSENKIIKYIGYVEKADENEARINLFKDFCDGLKELESFSHLIILYWFHLRDNEKERSVLQVIPRRHTDNILVGVFASRSPSRPNPIGLCIVKLIKITGCCIVVKGLDAFEGSPVIDIKPYIPKADLIPDAHVPDWILSGPKT